MKTIKSLLVVMSLLWMPSAFGDIFERINTCENSGGGACTFDLLRELANRGGGEGPLLPLKPGLYKKDGATWYHRVLFDGQSGDKFTYTIRYGDTTTPSSSTSWECSRTACIDQGTSVAIQHNRLYKYPSGSIYRWIEE
jgi:hypothetical protein